MSQQEPKLKKCKKIDALKVKDDEWDQVTKFNNLLGVHVLSISYEQPFILYCLWTRHSRHSLQINTWCYILQFQHLKHYIKLGTNNAMMSDTQISSNCLQRQSRNLLSIMTGQRTCMLILWQWVSQIASCEIHYHLHLFSSSSSWKAHVYQEILEQEASPHSSWRHWKNCRWINTWVGLLLTELFQVQKNVTQRWKGALRMV